MGYLNELYKDRTNKFVHLHPVTVPIPLGAQVCLLGLERKAAVSVGICKHLYGFSQITQPIIHYIKEVISILGVICSADLVCYIVFSVFSLFHGDSVSKTCSDGIYNLLGVQWQLTAATMEQTQAKISTDGPGSEFLWVSYV